MNDSNIARGMEAGNGEKSHARGSGAQEEESVQKALRSNMTCFLNTSGDIIAKNGGNIHTEKGWTAWKYMTELMKPIYRS